jgi:hypothetical protein
VRRALTCLLAAIAVASASAAGLAAAGDDRDPLDAPRVADLDGDGATETARIHETSCFDHDGAHKPPCAEDVLRTFFVEVTDSCAHGAVTLRLSREMEFMSIGEVIDADGDGQARELAFEARAGATARGVQSKVVRFRADADGCIAVQKTLFSYPRADTIGKRPKGTFFRTGYLGIANFDRSRPGLELRTEETYSRATDAGCCPSWQRVTYWRFVAATSRYRPYRTKLARVPRP